uniref:(northern house mosquito) hypothetical protein n=1 Tax=Culex pipiens TaxID=7175 RepID=A0A8D8C257_CULPI
MWNRRHRRRQLKIWSKPSPVRSTRSGRWRPVGTEIRRPLPAALRTARWFTGRSPSRRRRRTIVTSGWTLAEPDGSCLRLRRAACPSWTVCRGCEDCRIWAIPASSTPLFSV